jgi:TRAP transporter TAXI family solute receptor
VAEGSERICTKEVRMSKKTSRRLLRMGWILLAVLLCLSLVAVTACGTAPPSQQQEEEEEEEEEELPEVLNLGTMPVGMIVNAQAVGIAAICSNYTPISIKVYPATNEMVWVPMTATDEIQLGVASAVAMRQAYLGSYVFEDIADQAGVESFPLRVVAGGSPLRVNLFVPGDSPIETIPELEGTRHVTFAEGTHFVQYTEALLANGGLTLDDITPVPVANPVESVRAVMDDRADAGQVAVGAPIAAEAVANIGLRWLPVDPSPEAVQRMKDVVDVAYVAEVPGGVHIGIPEPQLLMHLDVVFVAHEDVSEAAVYELAKALWENNDELVEKPGLFEWTPDKYLSTEQRVPYHPGAIEFYKEIGIWTEEMEEFQEAVLAEEP